MVGKGLTHLAPRRTRPRESECWMENPESRHTGVSQGARRTSCTARFRCLDDSGESLPSEDDSPAAGVEGGAWAGGGFSPYPVAPATGPPQAAPRGIRSGCVGGGPIAAPTPSPSATGPAQPVPYAPLAFFTSSVSAGRMVKRSPTTPRSAMRKIGASASLLIATMCLELDIPARCWIAPEMPAAM
jgi:hypothetical protein